MIFYAGDGLGYDAEDKSLFQLPTVTKRPEEGNDCVLLRVGQSKPSHEPRVHVRGCFRCRPAAYSFTGIIRLATRQDVARVVEVHDRLEALEIAIVAIGFDEIRIGPLVHVAQRWHLKSAHVLSASGRHRASSAEGG